MRPHPNPFQSLTTLENKCYALDLFHPHIQQQSKIHRVRYSLLLDQLEALEGKHMSEKEIGQVMIRCHGAWDGWGETTSVTRTKTLCEERGEYWCCLKNYSGQRNRNERTELSCCSEV